jgi:hypothetical protein
LQEEEEHCCAKEEIKRYFGLRPRTAKLPEPGQNAPWTEPEEFRTEQLKQHHVLEPLDVNKIAPYAFDKDTVIISIDVESYERGHHLITEVGVSTLDTMDLVDLAPGKGGENWMKEIRSRHFRIKGREYLRNTEFCIGNPDAFDFGTSEFVSIGDAPNAVDACFEYPFSVEFKHDGLLKQSQSSVSEKGPAVTNAPDWPERQPSPNKFFLIDGVNAHGPTNADHDAVNKAVGSKLLSAIGDELPSLLRNSAASSRALSSIDSSNFQKGPKERNILLLGHDIGTDIAYLKQLGSKIFKASHSTYPIAAMETMATGTGNVSSFDCSVISANVS